MPTSPGRTEPPKGSPGPHSEPPATATPGSRAIPFAGLVKFRTRANLLFAVALVILARPDGLHLLWGLPLILAGAALRIWAAGTIKKQETLARTGPYGLMRHPLYFGTFLGGLGLVTAADSRNLLLLYVLFLLLFALFYFPTMRVEEAELKASFGAEAEAYFREVPFFFPLKATENGKQRAFRREPGPKAEGDAEPGGAVFSWAQVLKNREHEGLLGVVLILAVFIAEILMRRPGG